METAITAKTIWTLDIAHSSLEFSVKHMMISTVKGGFNAFNINLTSEGEDFTKGSVEVEIDTESITTGGQVQREGHLKAPDFFDVSNYPKAIFKSTIIERGSKAGMFKVHGDLTIKTITKPVTVDVEFNGLGVDPYGNTKAGFDFNTAINKTDFELNWNAPIEAGGLLVSNTVKIFGGLQFSKQKEA